MVAPWEVARLRRFAQPHLGNDHALGLDRAIEFFVFRRVNNVHAAGDDRNRAHRQRRLMGGRINTTRKARDDHQAGEAQFTCQNVGKFARQRSGIARTTMAISSFCRKCG
jgi:hypothetical protein